MPPVRTISSSSDKTSSANPSVLNPAQLQALQKMRGIKPKPLPEKLNKDETTSKSSSTQSSSKECSNMNMIIPQKLANHQLFTDPVQLTPIWDILGTSLGGICGQKIQTDLMTSHMFENFLLHIILKLREYLYSYVTRMCHVTSSSENYCAIKKIFPENLGIE